MSAKNSTPQAEPVAEQVSQITLVEFCTRISSTMRRPELLNGFRSAQVAKGVVKATPKAFQDALDEFRATPV